MEKAGLNFWKKLKWFHLQMDSIQTFSSLITSASTLLGMSFWVFVIPTIGMFSLIVYRFTGSSILAVLGPIPGLVVLSMMDLIPIWIVIAAGFPVGLLLVSRLAIFGDSEIRSAEMAPNQIIQDPNKLPVKKLETSVILPSGSPKTTVAVDLEKAFSKYPEGLKVYKELKEEYEGLGLIFQSKGLDNSVVNSKKIGELAQGLNTQGTALLVKALNLFQQRDISTTDEIVQQCKELTTELAKYTEGSTMYKMISDRLQKNTASIKLVKGIQDQLDELFMQVGLCTDSIRELRLQLPSLISDLPRDGFDRAMLELQTRIGYAQRVQAEYKRQGLG